MSKKPTIKDVAAHAGVSKSTVSLVLQNSPLVKAQTREVVQASMLALNYVRNRAAASLRGGSTGLVGLVINDLRNPFFTEFATSAQEALAEAGFATVIANTDENAQTQHRVIASMLEHEVSALLISPAYGMTKDTFDAMARAGVPVLQVLRKVDPRSKHFPFFSMDYAHGSGLVARHLVDQGYEKIAFVGGIARRQITEERLSGYLATMEATGREPTVLFGRATRDLGWKLADELIEAGVDAAMCFNDLVALGLSAALAQRGHQMAVTGFDDIEECVQVHPQLTSVHCDVKSFGRQAADILLNWHRGGEQPRDLPRQPVHLEVRASSQRTSI